MSIFTDIESWASKFEKDLEKLWTKAPTLTQVALTTLTFAGPVLETIFTIYAGQAGGAAVTAVITTAEQDLTAAQGLITTIGPTVSVASLIAGVSTDLSSLLTAGHVTDATNVANITLIVKELAALATSLSTSVATPVPTAVTPA